MATKTRDKITAKIAEVKASLPEVNYLVKITDKKSQTSFETRSYESAVAFVWSLGILKTSDMLVMDRKYCMAAFICNKDIAKLVNIEVFSLTVSNLKK